MGSAYALCQSREFALSVPVTAPAPGDLTDTALTLAPLTALTVMPSAGLAFLLPEAGEIVRYLAAVGTGLLDTAEVLSLLATGVLPWQAVASRAAVAVSATATMRRARRVGRLDVVWWQPSTWIAP